MSQLLNSIYNAVANLGEIKEDEQNKEIALALQAMQDDIVTTQQNESDSEDEETSYDEEDKKILLDKLRQILDEHANVFVIGPPGSGKSELATALQAKIGCAVVMKPAMTSVKCFTNDFETTVNNQNLFEKIQSQCATYCIPYTVFEINERIIDASKAKTNNKITIFENSHLEALSILLQHASQARLIDDITYTAARKNLQLHWRTAYEKKIFSEFRLFIMLSADLELCKKRLILKRENLTKVIYSMKYGAVMNAAPIYGNDAATATTTTTTTTTTTQEAFQSSGLPKIEHSTSISQTANLAKKVNHALNVTEEVSPQQMDLDSTFFKEDYLAKIFALYKNLYDNDTVKKNFNYTSDKNSKIMRILFPKTLDSASAEYNKNVERIIEVLEKEIQKRRRKMIDLNFKEEEKKILITHFSKGYRFTSKKSAIGGASSSSKVNSRSINEEDEDNDDDDKINAFGNSQPSLSSSSATTTGPSNGKIIINKEEVKKKYEASLKKNFFKNINLTEDMDNLSIEIRVMIIALLSPPVSSVSDEQQQMIYESKNSSEEGSENSNGNFVSGISAIENKND